MPGLIQAHVHLCQTLFRGLADDLPLEDWLVRRIWPLEAAHTEETVYASALLGAAELLLGGTTAILDMETVRHTGAAFRALERIGIRATVGKCLMDVHPEGAPSDLAESTDDALTDAAALAQRWHGSAGGRLRVCFAPRFVPSCSGPLLRAASDLAERFDAQLHTHAAETIVERETVLRTTGLEELAYLDSVATPGGRAALAHCVGIDSHEMDRLARQGTTVVHCPSSNLKLASGVAKIPELLAAGCRVAIGADGAPCNNGLDAFAEMRLAALIQKPRLGADALPAAQVLELATLGGARALGLEDEIGRIAPGKRADLVVLDLSQPHLHPFLGDPAPLIVYSAPADLHECKGSTAETEDRWVNIVAQGGAAFGLSLDMPAFGEAGTPARIRAVVRYARSLCGELGWPPGELNFPRAFLVEKAYPEDEVVISDRGRGQDYI